MSDRYLKVVLTVIALELGWLALNQSATPVTAQAQQAQPAATRVVITGIDLPDSRAFMPVGVIGGYRQIPRELQRQLGQQIVGIDSTEPLRIRAVGPVKVENDRPLLVESVKYTPGQRPGE